MATNVTMVFHFSVPMDPDTFNPVLNLTFAPSGPFTSPDWNEDNTEVSLSPVFGGYPAATKITWNIVPGGDFGLPAFASATGNPVTAASGTFTTGGSSGGGGGTTNAGACTISDITDPAVVALSLTCLTQPNTNSQDLGFVFVGRSASFLQLGATLTKPDTNAPFSGSVFARSTTANPFTGVKYTGPGQALRSVDNSGFGFFSYSAELATQSELDQAFPTGNYAINITRQSGALNLSIPVSSPVPAPLHIANFDDAQHVNTTQAFNLRWDAIAGAANTIEQGLTFQILEKCSGKVVFAAPNYCIPTQLKPTDTAVVIPAGTLLSNKRYRGELSYSRFFGLINGPVGGATSGSSTMTQISFPINDPGSLVVSDSPQITSFLPVAVGFTLAGKGTANHSYAIEVSADLAAWTELITRITDASGLLSFTIPNNNAPQRYFRLRGK